MIVDKQQVLFITNLLKTLKYNYEVMLFFSNKNSVIIKFILFALISYTFLSRSNYAYAHSIIVKKDNTNLNQNRIELYIVYKL